jgi:hypothetical protein
MNGLRLLIVPGLLSLVLAAACGGGGGVASARSDVRSSSGVAAGAAPAAASTSVGTAPAGTGTAPVTGPAKDVIPPVPEGPRVQRSARVVLEVASGRFDSTLDEVIAVVDQAGGYISGTDAQASEGRPLRSGQVTFQVPSTRFEAVLGEIRGKGTPQTISISGNDVSQQYVDLQARLQNAQAQRDAMLALMQQARSVSDTIQIENQLGQVTGQIEELKGQIQYLDHSTSFATVAVTIREAAAGPRDEWGLRTAVDQALHNVTAVLDVVIVVLGSLLPALVLGALLVVAGRRLWPRLVRRTASPTPAE